MAVANESASLCEIEREEREERESVWHLSIQAKSNVSISVKAELAAKQRHQQRQLLSSNIHHVHMKHRTLNGY